MRAAVLAAVLALGAPAGAQVVNADGTMPSAGQQQGQPDAMAGVQKQLHVAVQAGAEQGMDVPATMVIPTGTGGSVRIDIGDNQPGKAAGTTTIVGRAQPPPPSPLERALPYLEIAAAAAVLTAGFWLKSRPARVVEKAAFGELPFTITRVIGEGGMGQVFEAVDRNLDRKVAVKTLRGAGADDPAAHEQLLKEAKLVAALHHPNIVDIHSVVSQGGQDYMVFELVEGRDVQSLLKERKRLTLQETHAILDPVCRALEYAHSRGVVHRDLKPANVMITTLGQVKVMDFGIARALGSRAPGAAGAGPKPGPGYEMTQAVVGTLPFLSPEAWTGVVRPEMDVYALGVMAYALLSGCYPFAPDAPLDEKLAKRYAPLSKAVAGVPAGVDALIDAALEPDADKRIRSAAEFARRLGALAAGPSGPAPAA